MKYMLLIYGDEKALDDIEREQCYVKSTELACELHKILVTDGPFAETREQLGGYFLVEANNTDEAIDIATRIPMARFGTIEIRPVIEIPGLPKS